MVAAVLKVYSMFLQKLVKRSRKLVGRLACRDPTEDLDEVQPSSRENSASSEWDLDVEDLYDDQTVLSQVIFLLSCSGFSSQHLVTRYKSLDVIVAGEGCTST